MQLVITYSSIFPGIMLYGKDWKKMQPLIKTRYPWIHLLMSMLSIHPSIGRHGVLKW